MGFIFEKFFKQVFNSLRNIYVDLFSTYFDYGDNIYRR
jgi:hypothetical protein